MSFLSNLWNKYKTILIKVVIGVIILISLVFIGKYYANKSVNDFVNGVKAEWEDGIGRGFHDNIAKLQQRQETLDQQFTDQKSQINQLKNTKRQEFKNVISTKDPKQISNYFDRTVDSYIPEQ